MDKFADILDTWRVAIYKHFGACRQEHKIIEEHGEYGDEIYAASFDVKGNDFIGLHNLEDSYLEEQADLYNVLRQKYLCNEKMREYADKKVVRTIDRYKIEVRSDG